MYRQDDMGAEQVFSQEDLKMFIYDEHARHDWTISVHGWLGIHQSRLSVSELIRPNLYMLQSDVL